MEEGKEGEVYFFLLGKDLNGVIRFGIVRWCNFVILNMMFLNDVFEIIGKDIGLLAFLNLMFLNDASESIEKVIKLLAF